MISILPILNYASEEYFNQRKSNSTKVDLTFVKDIIYSFDSLKYALKYGQIYHDFSFPDLLFGNLEEREIEEESIIIPIEVNEKLTGQSLTHLTLHFYSAYLQPDLKCLYEGLECLELCPNLISLHLNFNYIQSPLNMKTLCLDILKLTKLKTLKIYLIMCQIAEDSLLILANQILELRNLVELDLNVTNSTGFKRMDDFYEEISQHKSLNTLKVKGVMRRNLLEAKIFGSTFNFRKIKRLVQKEIMDIPFIDDNDDIGFSLFD